MYIQGCVEMIVGVLTTCHTQHTWDMSICIFLNLIEQHSKFLLHTLQVLYMCTLCDSANINTIYFIFIVPCIITFYEITNRCNCTQWILFPYLVHSTCFGRHTRPSSGVEHCTPDDGRVWHPKHVEWTKQRNKIHCVELHLLVIS